MFIHLGRYLQCTIIILLCGHVGNTNTRHGWSHASDIIIIIIVVVAVAMSLTRQN